MKPNRFATALLGLALFGTGLPAVADTYQLTLKTDVGTGILEFDKSGGSSTATLTSFTFEDNNTLVSLPTFPVTVEVRSIQLEKPGTAGELECLQQGPNVVGVTRTDTTAIASTNTNRNYRVNFAFSFENGCPGQPAFTRTYSLQRVNDSGTPNGSPITGNYHIQNTATVPEPGVALLFLSGAGALVAVRRRQISARSRRPA